MQSNGPHQANISIVTIFMYVYDKVSKTVTKYQYVDTT